LKTGPVSLGHLIEGGLKHEGNLAEVGEPLVSLDHLVEGGLKLNLTLTAC
jgi:hypothetical protein